MDKTRFLRGLEQEHDAFLIRPRRFGKSLWVSLLEKLLRPASGPTPTTPPLPAPTSGRTQPGNRAATSPCAFNFSAVNDKLKTLEREFEAYCLIELEGTLERHPDLFPEAVLQRILAPPSIATRLSKLFRYAGDQVWIEAACGRS